MKLHKLAMLQKYANLQYVFLITDSPEAGVSPRAVQL